jgi:hypothetical protein
MGQAKVNGVCLDVQSLWAVALLFLQQLHLSLKG